MIVETKERHLKIPSKPESITQVESFAEKCRKEFKIHDDMYGNILVALTEAVNNAINHGNNKDRNKIVQVILQPSGHKLCYIIKDEGKGFDYNNIPDPTAPENIEQLAGRGVFLMKQLADMVIFSDNGSTVEMEFKL